MFQRENVIPEHLRTSFLGLYELHEERDEVVEDVNNTITEFICTYAATRRCSWPIFLAV
jgi:hypothetical protein